MKRLLLALILVNPLTNTFANANAKGTLAKTSYAKLYLNYLIKTGYLEFDKFSGKLLVSEKTKVLNVETSADPLDEYRNFDLAKFEEDVIYDGPISYTCKAIDPSI